jgi:hypothetical protein
MRSAILKRAPRGAAFTALALAAAGGCAGASPSFATVSKFPDEPRHAPGVAVDPTPTLPAATASDSVDDALVVLRAPADVSAARATVRAFFRAVIGEQPDALDALINGDGWVQTSPQSSRQSALGYWRARLAKFDYSALRGQLVYRESEIETYRPRDLDRLKASRRLPLSVSNDQVLVRVPIATSRVGRKRVFADEMLFVLSPKPGAGGYQIDGIEEDFQSP